MSKPVAGAGLVGQRLNRMAPGAGGSVGVGRAGGGSKEKSSETSLYVLVQLEHLRFERATCLCPQTASPFSHFVQGTPYRGGWV